MQDFIERSITVSAPREKVFATISTPELVVTWFPDAVTEGTYEVGSKTTFDFGEDGTAQLQVVTSTPVEYFAFRWYNGKEVIEDVLRESNNLVEFFLEEVTDGTKVTVKESGFTSLPADIAEKKFADNSGGWDYMMGRLEKAFTQN